MDSWPAGFVVRETIVSCHHYQKEDGNRTTRKG